jgi:hypothetical protein
LSVLGFLPIADDSGKTITSIRKSSDFASFWALYIYVLSFQSSLNGMFIKC